MEYPFYPIIGGETKKKIAALVKAGYGFASMDYAVNFISSQNNELFKAAVDRYYRTVFSNDFVEFNPPVYSGDVESKFVS